MPLADSISVPPAEHGVATSGVGPYEVVLPRSADSLS
jgi:hypothetical protein